MVGSISLGVVFLLLVGVALGLGGDWSLSLSFSLLVTM